MFKAPQARAVPARFSAPLALRLSSSAAEASGKGTNDGKAAEVAGDGASSGSGEAAAGDASTSASEEGETTGKSYEELASDLATTHQELEAVRAAHDELKERLLRSLADMENLRDRTSRQLATHKQHATESLIKSFLEVADNLDRAVTAVPSEALEEEADVPADRALAMLRGLRDGVLLTDRVLVQILQKQGVQRYDPSGDAFDPNYHAALFEVPHPELPEGTVAVVVKKGYRYEDRPLRAAEVGVAKPPPSAQ